MKKKKEENKVLKKWLENEFKEDLKKPLSETKEKYKKTEKYLSENQLKNSQISQFIIKKLPNREIIEIITREYGEDIIKNVLKERREELIKKVKKETGKKKEVMSLHIGWLLLSICNGFYEKVVNELIDYLKEKKNFDLDLLIHNKIKIKSYL